MNKNDIIKFLNGYKKGTYCKITYQSTDLANAAAKKAGMVVSKTTQATCRIGINYANIASVKAKAEIAAPKVEFKPWWHHSKENDCIAVHNVSGKEYLQIFASPNKSKVKYALNGIDTTKDWLLSAGYVNASKVNPSGDKPVVMLIPLDNIISLG